MKLTLFRYEPEDLENPEYDINAAKDPNLLRLLRGEDPVDDDTEISVPFFGYFISDETFKDLGKAIANSPTLKSLEVRGSDVEEHFSIHGQFEYELRFLNYVNRNRTIRHLLLHGIHGEEAIQRLNSFLVDNDNLESFGMTDSFLFHAIGMTHLKYALNCRKIPLKRIAFRGFRICNDMIDNIASFFTTHPDLTPRSISLVEGQVGDEGCSILSVVIRNSDIKLEEIELLGNEMKVTGFRYIAAALACRSRPMKYLSIGTSDEDDRASDNELIAFLREFSSKSELLPNKLVFGGNHIGPNGLRHLGDFLSNRMSPLEELRFNFIFFSRGSLREFFVGLQGNPHNVPKNLNFADTDLFDGNYVSPALAISEFLRRPSCSVESIFIENQDFQLDDEKVELFVNALNINHTLRELVIDGEGAISSNGWNGLSSVLCNATSIAATYASNHTIFRFGQNHQKPDRIRIFLAMNTHSDKRLVGRMKVIHAHFARNFDIAQFIDMRPSLLAGFLPCINAAFEERIKHVITVNVGEHGDDYLIENNTLTIHYLLLKNNLAMFDSVIPRGRKRARLEGR